MLLNTSEYSQVGFCCSTPCQHLRDGNLTLQGGQSEGTEGPQAVDRLGITGASHWTPICSSFHSFEGLEFIPIRVGFNSQYLRRHDTEHPFLQICPHRAGRGPGKYLPSKAPVYPSGAVTSGWTPFNIYPCGFHRSAAQARQTLLIKTGACFKGPHSGRQSALAGQKSPGHVAAEKPEMDALFLLHFPSSSFSTSHHPQL